MNRRLTQSSLLTVLLALLIIFGAATTRVSTAQSAGTLMETIEANPDLTTMTALLRQSEVNNLLNENGPFTLFAPTNAAFEALGGDTLATLQNDPTLLRQTMLTHVVNGRNRLERICAQGVLRSAFGRELRFTHDADRVRINDRATMVVVDIRTANGTLHIIDAVLAPEAGLFSKPLPKPQTDIEPAVEVVVDPNANAIVSVLARDGRFSTLSQVIDDANMTGLLGQHGPFTVFAPTDAAFAALSAESVANMANGTIRRQTLLHHVVRGNYDAAALQNLSTLSSALNKPIALSGITLVETDIPADNGIIHVIDVVLTPPAGKFVRNPQTNDGVTGSLIDVMTKDGRFTTFTDALETVALDTMLARRGDFTVIAPTDDAFDNLPDGTLEAMLQNHNRLRRVMRMHIASGKLSSSQLAELPWINTLNDETVSLAVVDGALILNGSVRVTVSDIEANNGTIHVLNAVLLPTALGQPVTPIDCNHIK